MDPSRCAAHPDALAVATCRRCGRFVCEECLEVFEEHPYCGDCHARPAVTGRAGWPGVALVVAVLGLVLGPLLSVPVIVLSSVHLRRIREGRERAGAEKAWRRARRAGWVAFGMWMLLGVVLVVLTALMVIRYDAATRTGSRHAVLSR